MWIEAPDACVKAYFVAARPCDTRYLVRGVSKRSRLERLPAPLPYRGLSYGSSTPSKGAQTKRGPQVGRVPPRCWLRARL